MPMLLSVDGPPYRPRRRSLTNQSREEREAESDGEEERDERET